MEAGKANTPKWDVAYSFREEYNVASLSPKSVAAIIASMAQDVDDSLLLSKYLDHFYTSRPPKCDASCRIDLLCNMNNTIYDETYSCNEALGVSFMYCGIICGVFIQIAGAKVLVFRDPGARHVTSGSRLFAKVISVN